MSASVAAPTQPMSSAATRAAPASCGRAAATSAARSVPTLRPAVPPRATSTTPSTSAAVERSPSTPDGRACSRAPRRTASAGTIGTMSRAYGIQSPPTTTIAATCVSPASAIARPRACLASAMGAKDQGGTSVTTHAAPAYAMPCATSLGLARIASGAGRPQAIARTRAHATNGASASAPAWTTRGPAQESRPRLRLRPRPRPRPRLRPRPRSRIRSRARAPTAPSRGAATPRRVPRGSPRSAAAS